MKHVLFYFSSLTESRIENWARCFEELSTRYNIDVSICFERDRDLQKVETRLSSVFRVIRLDDIAPLSVDYSAETMAETSCKYREYNLQKYRLQKMTLERRDVAGRGYHQRLCYLIDQFECLLDTSGADLVFLMEPKNLAWTANLFILEMVCKVQKAQLRFVHVLGSYSRLGIFENLFRVSRLTQEVFMRKKKEGLSQAELLKTEEFISNYRAFKQSDFAQTVLHKHYRRAKKYNGKLPSKLLKWRPGNLWKKGKNEAGMHRYDDVDLSNEKYVLFLPNKRDNGRANYLAPFYSDCDAVLVRAIALSIPVDYSLVIKDHPHVFDRRAPADLLSVVRQFDNCFYLDPRIDSMVAAETASIVVGVASTSVLEAVMLKKPIILFGGYSFNFGDNAALITQVTNLEELSVKINQCLTRPPPVEDSLCWIFAVLKTSFSWGQCNDEDWGNNSNTGFEGKWANLVKRGVLEALGKHEEIAL